MEPCSVLRGRAVAGPVCYWKVRTGTPSRPSVFVPGDVRIYEGRPIFRGLGNFLFDQPDRVATSTAKLVRLRYDNGRILFETLLAPSR